MWQWFSFDEYNEKFRRSSGTSRNLRAPAPPPAPKASSSEKGRGKSEQTEWSPPSDWSSRIRGAQKPLVKMNMKMDCVLHDTVVAGPYYFVERVHQVCMGIET
eukprot:4650701-Pyramimonas_sp.AAC.1